MTLNGDALLYSVYIKKQETGVYRRECLALLSWKIFHLYAIRQMMVTNHLKLNIYYNCLTKNKIHKCINLMCNFSPIFAIGDILVIIQIWKSLISSSKFRIIWLKLYNQNLTNTCPSKTSWWKHKSMPYVMKCGKCGFWQWCSVALEVMANNATTASPLPHFWTAGSLPSWITWSQGVDWVSAWGCSVAGLSAHGQTSHMVQDLACEVTV